MSFFIILLQLIVSYFRHLLNPKPTGSDNAIHLAIIRALRRDNSFFLTDVSKLNFFGNRSFGYPHLYHIFLARLPDSFLAKKYWLITTFIDVLTIIFWLFFVHTIYPNLGVTLFSESDFFILGGILFIFNPFNFYAWNAKHVGISARGLGVLLTHLYLYLTVFYLLNNSLILLTLIYILSMLIVMSSIFAFQFVLFFSIIGVFFFRDALLFISPIIGLLTFFLINKKALVDYLKVQYWHKLLYYRYVAPASILQKRYSIWRDLVWDIWIKFFENNRTSLLYAKNNSVLTLLLGFPSLVAISFIYISQFHLVVSFNPIIVLMFSMIIIALIIFILTSFRNTRFLGEPERYIELVFPMLPILLIWSDSNSELIYIIILYSILYSMLNLFHSVMTNKKIIHHIERINKVKQFLNVDGVTEDRIACNGKGLIKYLIASDYKILHPRGIQTHIGSFHFEEIFAESFSYLSKDIFIPLAMEFNVRWVIFNTKYYSFNDIKDTSNLRLLGKVDEFEIAELTCN